MGIFRYAMGREQYAGNEEGKSVMRIYLDNCCFNRPFDEQTQIRIKLETEAKLYIQTRIKQRHIELAWSYLLDHENQANPYEDRKTMITPWKYQAVVDVDETPEILEKANALQQRSLRSKDAIHVACAIEARCDYFLTTDDFVLKKLRDFAEIAVISPLTFITLLT